MAHPNRSTATSKNPQPLEKAHPAFAASLNQATHNLHLLLNDIAGKTGQTMLDEERNAGHRLLQVLPGKDYARQAVHAITLLNRSFGWIETMQVRLTSLIWERKHPSPKRTATSDANNQGRSTSQVRRQQYSLEPSHYAEWLKIVAELLNTQRNLHTHAYHPMERPDEDVVRLLERLFDTAVRTVKTRFGFDESTIAHLRRKVKGKPPHNDNPKFNFHFVAADGRFTEWGLAFFNCLFLSKQDGMHLLGQLPGLKDSRKVESRASREVFTCFHLRLPTRRIDSENTQATVALDMLGELLRCSRLLFEHLPEAHQKAFETERNMGDGEGMDTGGEGDPDAGTGNTVLLLRSQERFAPLMLRYFDQTNTFERLRFCLDLGNFAFKTYNKTLYDDSTPVRRLVHKVLRFARLPEAETAHRRKGKPAGWLALEQDPARIGEDYDQPYISQTWPHYHLEGDNIPLRLLPQKGTVEEIYPNIEPVTVTDNTAAPGSIHSHPAPKNAPPDFWLSRHELLHLSFYQLLHDDLFRGKGTTATAPLPDVETILQEYQNAHRVLEKHIRANTVPPFANERALENWLQVHTGYGKHNGNFLATLRVQDLPTVLRDHLLSLGNAQPRSGHAEAQIKAHAQAALRTIDSFLQDNTLRLQRLERQTTSDSKDRRTQPGAAKHQPLRAGALADFLARDILRLQPVQNTALQNRGKATSLMFAELQARLAFFGRDKDCLPNLCASIGLIDSPAPHPFLAEALSANATGIIRFAEVYLQKRKDWLERIRITLRQTPIANRAHPITTLASQYAWLRHKAPPKGQTEILAHLDNLKGKRVPNKPEKHTPLNLPRGLFLPFTLRALQALGNPALSAAIQASPRLNTSYLIGLYYQHCLGDRHQQHYDAQRNYPLLDRVFDDREDMRQPLPPRYLHIQFPYPNRNGTNTGLRAQHQTNIQEIQGWLQEKAAEHDDSRTPLRPYHRFEHNEKNIREVRTQDMVLFMATQKMLALDAGLGNTLSGLKLQTLNREVLEKSVPYHMHLHGKEVHAQAIKIKNIPEMRQLLKDRRIPGLFAWYPQPHIDYRALVKELEDYQRMRLDVITALHAFERRAVQRFGQPPGTEKGTEHKWLLEQWAQHTGQSSQDWHPMVVLRNSFMHNQLPNKTSDYVKRYADALPFLDQAMHTLHQALANTDRSPTATAPSSGGAPPSGTSTVHPVSVVEWFARETTRRYEAALQLL